LLAFLAKKHSAETALHNFPAEVKAGENMTGSLLVSSVDSDNTHETGRA
jgi:hypothetical protein